MMENEWLNKEIRNLKKDMNHRKTPNVLIFGLIMLTMLTSFMSYDTQNRKLSERRGNWSSTWICPRCGHENYSEISNCGVCGHDKPKKRR